MKQCESSRLVRPALGKGDYMPTLSDEKRMQREELARKRLTLFLLQIETDGKETLAMFDGAPHLSAL